MLNQAEQLGEVAKKGEGSVIEGSARGKTPGAQVAESTEDCHIIQIMQISIPK